MANIVEAILSLKPDAIFSSQGTPTNEEEYKTLVKYITGEDENGHAIFGDIPSELTWVKVKAEMDKS